MQIHCSPEFIRKDRETEEKCNPDIYILKKKKTELAMKDGEKIPKKVWWRKNHLLFKLEKRERERQKKM